MMTEEAMRVAQLDKNVSLKWIKWFDAEWESAVGKIKESDCDLKRLPLVSEQMSPAQRQKIKSVVRWL